MKYLLILSLLFSSQAFSNTDDSCVARVQVSQSRVFNNQFSAQQYCNSFGNLRQFCSVSRLSNNRFAGNFRSVFQANDSNFIRAVNRAIQAINNVRLLRNAFNFVVNLVGNDRCS